APTRLSPLTPERPPIADAPISVILLAHNEETHLETVVQAWIGELNGLERDYEVVIVDDGSTDRTLVLLEILAAQEPRLRLLHHEKPAGIGAALRSGLT